MTSSDDATTFNGNHNQGLPSYLNANISNVASTLAGPEYIGSNTATAFGPLSPITSVSPHILNTPVFKISGPHYGSYASQDGAPCAANPMIENNETLNRMIDNVRLTTPSSRDVPKNKRFTCSICKRTCSRKSDLWRHVQKHDSKALKHVCWIEGCKYGGSYREDKLKSHVRNCHPEWLSEKAFISWKRCSIMGCDFGGHLTEDIWINHNRECHSNCVRENGELRSVSSCYIGSCRHYGRFNERAWVAHYRYCHSSKFQILEEITPLRPCLMPNCSYQGLNSEAEWSAHYYNRHSKILRTEDEQARVYFCFSSVYPLENESS